MHAGLRRSPTRNPGIGRSRRVVFTRFCGDFLVCTFRKRWHASFRKPRAPWSREQNAVLGNCTSLRLQQTRPVRPPVSIGTGLPEPFACKRRAKLSHTAFTKPSPTVPRDGRTSSARQRLRNEKTYRVRLIHSGDLLRRIALLHGHSKSVAHQIHSHTTDHGPAHNAAEGSNSLTSASA